MEDGNDFWPTFQVSPDEYERAVANIVQSLGHGVTDWRVAHLDKVEGVGGTYEMDVTVRFRLIGMDFLRLFECKRHSRPVEREDVLVLHAKLESIKAQKGVLVAASGFQSGALEYAKANHIACVRLLDDSFVYETRGRFQFPPTPTGNYVAYAIEFTEEGFTRTLLTGQPEHARDALLNHP